MLYTYNIKIPLIYNKFSIDDLDSEFRFNLDRVVEEKLKINYTVQDIPEYKDELTFDDEMTIKIYCTYGNEKDNPSNVTPDPFITCLINGIIADDEQFALQIAEKYINSICRELSLVLNRRNANRHLYQPRIEADWRKTVINRDEYAPYLKKYSELVKENNKAFHLTDRIQIRATMCLTIILRVPSDEIKIVKWLNNDNLDIDFVCNEYYLALGSENIKSKFFHLFTIIEFCEREYKGHNKSKPLISNKDIENIIDYLKENINFSNKENLLSRINKSLIDATDIGRAQKLLNILEWMGIKSYKKYKEEIFIDKRLIQSLIDLRNKTFHGAIKEKLENINEYKNAVGSLFYIDEMIIDFMKNNEY